MKSYILSKQLVNRIGEVLNPNDKDLFNTFLCDFSKTPDKINIYRGTNDLSAYRINDNDLISSFSDKLFMVEVKAARFAWDEKRPMLLKEEAFKKIFVMIKQKCLDNKFSTFFLKNDTFKLFFEKKSNMNIFIDKIMNCTAETKLQIQDYYYALLQTMDDKISNNGCMISTTTNIKVAEKYQQGRKSNHKSSIMIVAWIPKHQKDIIIRYNDVNRNLAIIQAKELPTFEESPYPYQKEICLKYGIFPQFIIGYSYRDKFIINPYLLFQLKTIHNVQEIIMNGIKIDQSKFAEILHQTGFMYGFTSFDDEKRILLDKLSMRQ